MPAQPDADRNRVSEPTSQRTQYASADLTEPLTEVAEESMGAEEGKFS